MRTWLSGANPILRRSERSRGVDDDHARAFASTPARGTSFKRFCSNDYVDPEAMRFYPLLPIVAGVAQNATGALNSAA